MRNRLYWLLGFVLILGLGVLIGAGVLLINLQTPVVQAAANLQATVVPNVQTTESRDTGLLVGAVTAGSPADKAGIVRGDIILDANGTVINQANRAGEMTLLQNLKPGDKLTLKVLHGDETKTVDVILGDQNGNPYLGISPAFTARFGFFGGPGKAPNGLQAPGANVTGAWVVEVTAGGPADKAGMKVGDVILKINDAAVNASNDLAKALQSFKPGDSVKVSVQRSGQTNPVDLQVTLGNNPTTASQAFLGIRYQMVPLANRPNLTPNGQNNGPVNPNLPFRRLPNGVNAALLVGAVTSGGPADKAGVKARDVITQVNGKIVTTPDDFVNQVKAAKVGDQLTLTITRNNDQANPLTIAVTLAANPDNSGQAYLGVTLAGQMRGTPRVTPNNKPTVPGGNT